MHSYVCRYLQMIIEANAHAHQLLIFDARPVVNAKVNKVSAIFAHWIFHLSRGLGAPWGEAIDECGQEQYIGIVDSVYAGILAQVARR